MNASTGRTIGIILLVIFALAAVAGLRFLAAPWGLSDGIFHVFRGPHFRTGFWPFPILAVTSLIGLALLAVWIAVVVWVYRDAEKRGMSGVLWALVVFFAHVIGLIIYVILRSDHPVLARPSGAPLPTCPRCGKPMGEQHTFCPHCGGKLKPACPKCGAEVQSNWKACPHCGETL